MISRFQSKFGTAGLVVAIVALVVALTGVAVAATGLNSKQKKEVKKIAKQFAGKPGAPGATGPAGPQGAPGAKGDKGDKGDEGPEGPEGPEGDEGPEGSPWTAGGTLPPGETETGAWAARPAETGSTYVSLSFNIPLAEAPLEMHYVKEDGTEKTTTLESATPVNCLGSVDNPTAPPGTVCIYAKDEALTSGKPGFFVNFPFNRLFASGAVFIYGLEGADRGVGTWAVTAAE